MRFYQSYYLKSSLINLRQIWAIFYAKMYECVYWALIMGKKE